jgi:mannose-6-phosphate isomerase-like protein (cupin superfamily)
MSEYATKRLPELPDVTAPDGSDVRILLGLEGGDMAHFELAPGEVSTPVTHRTVEEVWYVVDGEGEMWRRQGDREEVTKLRRGTCLTIPLGTAFQFRAMGDVPLSAVAVTMPPWPGEGEAVVASGPWVPTVGA